MSSRELCRECGDILAGNQYIHKYKTGMKDTPKLQKDTICKPCKIMHANIRYRLMKIYPPPPPGTPCTACNRVDKLFLDHDHAISHIDWRKSFRGYICKNCNSSLGLGGDCEEGVLKLLAYLRSVPDRQVLNQNLNGRGNGETVDAAMERERVSGSGASVQIDAEAWFEIDSQSRV